MKRQQRLGLLITLLAVLSVTAGWWLAPKLLASLPTRVQSHLPESLYAVVHTPLPRSLPTPIKSPNSVSPTIVVPADVNVRSSNISNFAGPVDDYTASITGQVAANSEDLLPALTPLAERADTQVSLPLAVNISGLEIIAQKFNNCGPANLTMVLDYYGHEIDQSVIGDLLKPNYEDRNVSPHELVSYVNENSSMQASAYRGGDIFLLKRFLAAGFPVIIEKGLWLDLREGWMGHYLTLVGYDDVDQSFLSLDTFLGPWDNSGRLVSYDEVSEKWHQFNNLFIVVRSPEEEEAFQSLLPPELRDPAEMWQQAAQKAQALLTENDADAYAWFNLAASLTHLGELTGDVSHFDSAAISFDRARELGLPWRMLWYQFEPYQAYLVAGRIADVKLLTEVILIYEGGRNIEETYLYRGHALLAEGDRAGAVKAYQRALRLNPAMSSAQAALDLLD
jgi:tetratricopeptide (TPR) repeat protein